MSLQLSIDILNELINKTRTVFGIFFRWYLQKRPMWGSVAVGDTQQKKSRYGWRSLMVVKHTSITTVVIECSPLKYLPIYQGYVLHPILSFDQNRLLKRTLWFELFPSVFLWSVKVRGCTLVFCYQNYSDLLWEKNVLVIKKNFWNSRLKVENLQNFWEH